MRVSSALTIICGVLTVVACWQSTHGGPVPSVTVVWFAAGTVTAAVLTGVIAWIERR